MNQTTWPPRDPLKKEEINAACWAFPRASECRTNAVAEFPVCFLQTGEETRSFQDLMLSQILLIIPLFLLSRHGGRGGETERAA